MKILKLRGGRLSSSFVILGIISTGIFLCYNLLFLYNRYGSLFYFETFLPSPPLPEQHIKPSFKMEFSKFPRILCLIVTAPKYHKSRALHVKQTWSKHCDRAVFLTTKDDPSLGEVIISSNTENYYQLWEKVISGFLWASNNMEGYDWLIKADDDTFLLLENLKRHLSKNDPNKLLATGTFLKDWDTEETYLSGGASYAVTREVVKQVTNAVKPGGPCTADGGMTITSAEDLNMASCYRKIGVTLLDSRDSEGKQMFNVFPPQSLVDPRQAYNWKHLWLKKVAVYPYKFGLDALSSDVISFHYVDGETMYLLYYLIYMVNPHQKQLQQK